MESSAGMFKKSYSQACQKSFFTHMIIMPTFTYKEKNSTKNDFIIKRKLTETYEAHDIAVCWCDVFVKWTMTPNMTDRVDAPNNV
jgi:hypothetical protein